MTDETETNLVEDDALLSSETGVSPDDDDQIEGGDTEQDVAEDDDNEEVEHDGQKFRIPKALKPALMMHADYTRKTQELAETRKELEQQRSQALNLDQELVSHQAKIVSIDERLAEYAKVDWDALADADPDAERRHWRQFQQLKDARQQAVGALQHKAQQRSLEQQRIVAKQVEEGQAVLARDIKDWSPELAGKLTTFGQKEFGLTAAELSSVTDPRMIKVLHRAFQADQALKKQTAVAKAEKAQEVRPTPRVSGASAPPKGLDDRLSADEWVKRRNEQLRPRRG